jgi:hypothetical protein
MKTVSTNLKPFESTYALLVRSEEKQRSRFETLIYMLLIVSVILAVAQFGRQPVVTPSSNAGVSTPVSSVVSHGA